MIRPIRLTDLLELRHRPYSRIALFNELTLARAHRPLLFATRCSLPLSSDTQTLVYSDRGLRGYIQSRCRSFTPEADIVYLAAQPFRSGQRQPTDPDVWYRLLQECISRMGARAIERLYAPLPSNSEVLEVFRQLGFQPYAHRQVWRALTPEVAEGSALIALRPQQRRDPHAIQRLYESITPTIVQRAEMRNSRSWQLPVVRSRATGVRERSWVLGRDGRDDVLRAALHLWQGSSAAVFTLLIDPAERSMASSVLRFGLSQLSASHQGAVYVLLPEYHSELGSDLGEIGFECLGDQLLLVKSTVVPLRKPLLRPVLEGGLEVVRPSVTSSLHPAALATPGAPIASGPGAEPAPRG